MSLEKIRHLMTLATLAFAPSLHASDPKPTPLWPGPVPGEHGGLPAETSAPGPDPKGIAGRPIEIISNVSVPTLTVYKPEKSKDTGAAVVVCPGGGYYILAWDLEGTEVCDWLNSIGVTGVLLKYRVPRREGQPPYAAPLQDAERAMGIVRSNADQLGIDPHRIGILGFSAGANLAAVLCNNHESRTYPAVDAADAVGCRPDFCVLVYPAYLTLDDKGEVLAPEMRVQKGRTPPTFIVMAEDDPVGVRNALIYYAGLGAAGVPAEMHLYAEGGHGYGLRRTSQPVTTWTDRAGAWLQSGGWLARRPEPAAAPGR